MPRFTAAQTSQGASSTRRSRFSRLVLEKVPPSLDARDQHSFPPTLLAISSAPVATRSITNKDCLPVGLSMKRLRLQKWCGSILSPRSRPCRSHDLSTPLYSLQRCRHQTTASLSSSASFHAEDLPPSIIPTSDPSTLPSPPVSAARTSAKVAALHARLSLPQKLPLETLARTLVDASADPSPRFNNASLAVLGGDLLSYYTSEYIIAQYPRLPLAVVFAAMYAYCGPKALAAITREWGVEYAAHPGGEVDPGYLQFARLPPEPKEREFKLGPETIGVTRSTSESRPNFRRGISGHTIYSDEFGDAKPGARVSESTQEKGVTAEKASTNFVRAVMGAIYLHAGRPAAKKFFRDHFRSRQLNMASLFQFRTPTQDLSRLCAREGFQAPVARILAETGRQSRHPVYIVGVFSGNDKLGEGAGASLDEAKTRSAVAALKGWYLYSPLQVRVPSDTEESGAKPWEPIMIDSGDVVV